VVYFEFNSEIPGFGDIPPKNKIWSKTRSFFLSGRLYTIVTPASEEDFIQQHPDILQVRELVGIYEITVRDVEVPLKIKIMRSGSKYYGIANLAVREKGAKDYYRDSGIYSSKEAAVLGVVEGFFLHLQPGASIREIKNWGI
jgi:hypothetical protein